MKKMKVEKMTSTGKHAGVDVFSAIEKNNQFLTNMAYQMRTALNAITGFSEILAMDELQYEQKEHVFEINRASRALTHLLNDVIDFTRISQQKTCDVRDCNIAEILDEIKSVIGFRAESKGIELKVIKSDMAVQSIKTNNRNLLDSITRLADMTIKLAKTDMVEIRVKSDCPEFVVFEFCGGNIALTEDVITDLFKPFSSNLDEVYKDIEDTGLGFAVAAKLCHSIGADLSVGQVGTLFVLTIPSGCALEEPQRSRLVEEFIKQKKTQRTFEPTKLDRSPRILVAEDNPSNQMVIKILLGRMGCEVDVVYNGVEAVEKACSEDYDAILMDIRMPEMDGIEAAGIIIDKGVVCPIIALTAMDESDIDNNSQRCRFDAHIYKPIDAEVLKTVLGRFLIFDDSVVKQKV